MKDRKVLLKGVVRGTCVAACCCVGLLILSSLLDSLFIGYLAAAFTLLFMFGLAATVMAFGVRAEEETSSITERITLERLRSELRPGAKLNTEEEKVLCEIQQQLFGEQYRGKL